MAGCLSALSCIIVSPVQFLTLHFNISNAIKDITVIPVQFAFEKPGVTLYSDFSFFHFKSSLFLSILQEIISVNSVHPLTVQ